jgi:hypothetical protein
MHKQHHWSISRTLVDVVHLHAIDVDEMWWVRKILQVGEIARWSMEKWNRCHDQMGPCVVNVSMVGRTIRV